MSYHPRLAELNLSRPAIYSRAGIRIQAAVFSTGAYVQCWVPFLTRRSNELPAPVHSGSAGYVALFEIEADEVIAVRHQREDDDR